MTKIAVWFSCGAASAVAAKLTIDKYGVESVRVMNSHVEEEDADNRRFLADVSDWLGVEIEDVNNPKYAHCSAVKTWDLRGAMSFPHGAPCTVHLKKEARQHWEKSNHVDWHVLGFAADEEVRHERFIQTERSNVLPILIDANITRSDCHYLLRKAGIRRPAIYDRGYPNANCIGCVKATSPEYWNHVRRDSPEVFKARAEQSRRLGVQLVRVNNKRIFLDELDPTASGRKLTSFDVPDCGLFCEELPLSALLSRGKQDQ